MKGILDLFSDTVDTTEVDHSIYTEASNLATTPRRLKNSTELLRPESRTHVESPHIKTNHSSRN